MARGKRSTKDKFKSELERKFAAVNLGLPYEANTFTYVQTRSYTPDFAVSPTRQIELKGQFLPSDRTKHLLIKAQHPKLEILFIFANPNMTLSKKSKTTYGDWATKHGYKWCSPSDTTYIKRFINGSLC